MSTSAGDSDIAAVLQTILSEVKTIKSEHSQLASAVDQISGRVNVLAGVKEIKGVAQDVSTASSIAKPKAPVVATDATKEQEGTSQAAEVPPRRSSLTSKITLTSYPGQAGVDPLNMSWGHEDPHIRGPVVVSRHHNTIGRRNGEQY